MTPTDEHRAVAQDALRAWGYDDQIFAMPHFKYSLTLDELATLLATREAWAVADAMVELIEKIEDGPALDGLIRAMGHNPTQLAREGKEAIDRAIAAYDARIKKE